MKEHDNMEECKWHQAVDVRTTANENNINKIFEILDKVRNRLPLWATFTISLLMAIVGWLLRHVN